MLINLLNFFLLLNIFLVPIVPAFFGLGFELIKVVTFLILTLAGGFIFIFLLAKKRIKIRRTKIKTAALIFLLILTITSLAGINPFESLVGNYPYYQGLIIYWLLFLFFLIVSQVRIKSSQLVNSISASAVLVSLVSIIQFIQLNFIRLEIPNYAGRVVSTFGQPNLYSGFLLLTLPFVYQLKSRRVLWICLIFLGIILSFSRAAIILLFGLFIFWIIKRFREKSLIIFLLGFLLINALVYSLENPSGIVRQEVIMPLVDQKEEGYAAEKRIYIGPIIFDIFLTRPVLGFGIDSINDLYREHFSDFKPELRDYPPLYFNLMNLTVDRSHNYFLDLLVFSGVLGLVAYLCLVFLLFKNIHPSFMKIFLILYLVWIQFQVQSIVQLILFWLVAGTIDNKENMLDDES